ncbi:ferredoxin [Streptomyces sp. NPDC048278]|uniref:ferredoxin n=1 Tax=Streptomyces sp. NPDC048278 TaxID=3155809 RepID=UPI0034425AC2
MKITIDEELCCASGLCTVKAPDVFDQREEDGIAVLLLADAGPEHHESVKEAAAVCPAVAIHLAE